jgi:hypothetical protein
VKDAKKSAVQLGDASPKWVTSLFDICRKRPYVTMGVTGQDHE